MPRPKARKPDNQAMYDIAMHLGRVFPITYSPNAGRWLKQMNRIDWMRIGTPPWKVVAECATPYARVKAMIESRWGARPLEGTRWWDILVMTEHPLWKIDELIQEFELYCYYRAIRVILGEDHPGLVTRMADYYRKRGWGQYLKEPHPMKGRAISKDERTTRELRKKGYKLGTQE